MYIEDCSPYVHFNSDNGLNMSYTHRAFATSLIPWARGPLFRPDTKACAWYHGLRKLKWKWSVKEVAMALRATYQQI